VQCTDNLAVSFGNRKTGFIPCLTSESAKTYPSTRTPDGNPWAGGVSMRDTGTALEVCQLGRQCWGVAIEPDLAVHCILYCAVYAGNSTAGAG